jgi:hypothetical protein
MIGTLIDGYRVALHALCCEQIKFEAKPSLSLMRKAFSSLHFGGLASSFSNQRARI